MNMKKALSMLAAAALSISSFAAPAVTASANGTSYIYASTTNGAAQNGANGAITGVTLGSRYNTGGRAGDGGYTIDPGVSAALKAEFDSNNDNVIDSIYTDQYMDYIKSVSVNVALPAGVYTIYYVGVSANSVGTVTAGDTTLPSGAKTTLHTGSDKADLDVYAIKNICFPSGYSGDIVFDNGNSWLPDVTAIKIIQTDKTQNDVIVVDDITRPGRENNFVTVSGASANDSYSKYSSIFGEGFLSGITKFANYTDSADYYYVRVTEAASYNFYILSENTTGTNFTVENTATGASVGLSTGSFTQVGTYSGGKVYAANTDAAYLTEGIYKINLVKSGNYYSNFIAAAMHKMDHGTVTTDSNNSTVTYNVGADSGVGNSRAEYHSEGFIDNSQAADKKFILNFGYISLNDAFNTVTVKMGISGSNTVTSLKVKVDGEQIAEFNNINNLADNWGRVELTPTAIDASKKNLSGLLTIEASYTGSYAGNYEYVKFYTKAPAEEKEIAKGETIELSSTGSSYQRFTGKGGNPADAYLTSIDFSSQYAANGLKWYITKTENEKTYVAEYGNLGTTFSGGTVYFGLIITGSQEDLDTITKVELR